MKRLSSSRKGLSLLGLWRIGTGSSNHEPRVTPRPAMDAPPPAARPLVALLRQAQARGSAPAYVATLLATGSTQVEGGAE